MNFLVFQTLEKIKNLIGLDLSIHDKVLKVNLRQSLIISNIVEIYFSFIYYQNNNQIAIRS